jgi:hypothetical protein
MAKIKELELKAVHYFNGHDGYGVSANLYMDGKKIGEMLDDGWGGGIQIHIASVEKQKEFSERVQSYFAEQPDEFETDDIFLNYLLDLWNLQKEFKKMQKKGFPILLHMEFRSKNPTQEEWEHPVPVPKTFGILSEVALEKTIQEHNPKVTQIFRSLDDFNIQ